MDPRGPDGAEFHRQKWNVKGHLISGTLAIALGTFLMAAMSLRGDLGLLLEAPILLAALALLYGTGTSLIVYALRNRRRLRRQGDPELSRGASR